MKRVPPHVRDWIAFLKTVEVRGPIQVLLRGHR